MATHHSTQTAPIQFLGVNDPLSFDASGLLTFDSAASTPYTAKSGTYAIATTDYTIDCTSGTFTATLPTAVGVAGKVYHIKNSGTGTITVATTSSQTIDGATTQVLSDQYTTLTVQSTGANWIIL